MSSSSSSDVEVEDIATQLWKEQALINEVQKAGARLKRVMKEVHYARVAYTEALIVYQQKAETSITLSSMLWDDVVSKKKQKLNDAKATKQPTAICGEDPHTDTTSPTLSTASSSRPSKASTPQTKFRNAEYHRIA